MKSIDLPDGGLLLLTAIPSPSSRIDRHERERAAVQKLVDGFFGCSTSIGHNPDGSPFLAAHSDTHISISHCRHMAAVALAPYPVGVDIEEAREQLRRVAGRVFSETELCACGSDLTALLRAWTLKEALYKLMPSPEARDFRRAITITPPAVCGIPARILLTAAPAPETIVSVVAPK